MNMAELIVKVVKATNPHAHLDGSYSTDKMSHSTRQTGKNHAPNSNSKTLTTHRNNSQRKETMVINEDIELGGIKRTMETRVEFVDNQDCESRSSSTRDLTYPYK
jgi:hypothetical protein